MKAPNITEDTRHHDPFVVPEGYFDTLADRVMERVAAEESKERKHTHVLRLVWRWTAAACIVIAAGVGAWQYTAGEIAEPDLLYADNESDEDWDAAFEYSMIGNEDIAYYLTEAY